MKGRTNYAHRITKECDGILPYHEIFYIRSIQFSAGRAQTAFEAYRERAAKFKSPADTEELIFTFQEALGHCAAVSRYFWPVKPDNKHATARAKKLRDTFHLEDHDPLYQARWIRNTIEHFDEKIDQFCSRDPVGTIYDLIVESSDLADEEVTHVLRLLDPSTETIVLFGRKYNFSGIEASVRRIYDSANFMDKNGGRLKSLKRGQISAT